ncbi:unnamed protein product [Mytilus edulis]|uniref:Tyr recombinase domain-containing protein n=1 Tax=Mytilus edulis TaxID=6550 RepID=A0A8S3SS07_MYTED|nr:unnamed protein product [Mytilus edulis]
MPKQKSRTRRKAAPQSIEEDVPNLVEEQSEIPPLYRPPVRRRKTRRAVPETITEQPSVPTANDIADALFPESLKVPACNWIGEIAVKTESEIYRVIQREDIKFERVNGHVSNMTITMKFYKHSNLQSKTLSIARRPENYLCPVKAIEEYLRLQNCPHGPLFRFKCGKPVSGLDTNFYKGHSFRIGAATSAAARGVPLALIQSMGRWKSNAFQHYIRLDNFHT